MNVCCCFSSLLKLLLHIEEMNNTGVTGQHLLPKTDSLTYSTKKAFLEKAVVVLVYKLDKKSYREYLKR